MLTPYDDDDVDEPDDLGSRAGFRGRRALRRIRRAGRREARGETEQRSRPGRRSGLADLAAACCAIALVGFGALNLWAMGEPDQAVTKLATAAVGVVALLVLWWARITVTPRLAWAVYAVAIVLLVLVLAVGAETNQAVRWLVLGPTSLQPSELTKVALVLALAALLGVRRPGWRRSALAVVVIALPVGLVVVEPDLSTATLLVLVSAAMLVIGRVPARFLLPVVAAAVVAAPLGLGLMRQYQLERLGTFLSGSQSAEGPGWAVRQAQIAIARGGWFGDRADPVHALAVQYLPERETDLALASLVSGWGLVAGIGAVLAGLVVVWRVAVAAREPRTPTGSLLCAGFAVLLGIELVVSVGGNLGLLPVAGVPFPVLSNGGTASVVHLVAIGLVLGGRRDGARRRLWAPSRVQAPRPRLVLTALVALTAVLAVFGLLGARLHVEEGDRLALAGQTQMTRCITVPAPRGPIVDRHGTVLAADAGARTVLLVPALAGREPATVDRLAGLLGRPAAQLHALVDGAPGTTMSVDAGTVPAATGDAVMRAALPGVVVVPAPQRTYPAAADLAPVLGFVGAATPQQVRADPALDPRADVGRSGLESWYDGVLRGVDGSSCFWVDPSGRPVGPAPSTAPVPGATLQLSIDLAMQQRLTDDVAASLKGGPTGAIGAAVALDPIDGAVLAMASVPSYDPAVYGPPLDTQALAAAEAVPGQPMTNHVTQSAVPPGSTYKLVNASAALLGGWIPPDEVIPTGGSFSLGDHTFNNWRVLPPQDMVQAIAWSNDVYFYKLAWALGPDRLTTTARAFGVGAPTGIDLPGESAGYLGTPASVTADGGTWYPGSTVILGIGQGALTVTPLQDARWTAAVATGNLVTPRLAMAVGSGPGAMTPLPKIPVQRLPFADALGPVRDGMRAVVTSGTGTALGGVGVPVGAKSGTAEDPSVPGGGIDDWMTAAAPWGNPDLVVTALTQHADSSSTAAGVVADMMRNYGNRS
ncbi:FtsW/RodA/SpoVE family cell cycle protein [Actinomycetospora endophytica]|uniref:FtsW/RodA/SpoVE family cell cycle protein n=1 Tax=Actinomycetospora endophytica TaxID=2291215 RepID=A0ABS8PDX9_9PSEU|nr:FtsW/RodA/SpoVE family cell cycle protein [Actinomycetospora endophytica]MCD2195204.1 FtsW/RodA/SpoVE family cell cycle protein [Actinomycetospora endophytica]